MKKLLLSFAILFCASLCVLANGFVPEFDKMQNLRCDFEESIFDQNNNLITKNKMFRLFRLDDEYKKIYLQKEPIDKVLYYETDKIEFKLQSMTDDVIMMSHTVINRNTSEYSSTATITYDNPAFGTRYSKSSGICKIIP